MRRIGVVLVAVLVAGVLALLRLAHESPGSRALMCPGPHSAVVFHDVRSLCASRATALASIDADGDVTFFTPPEAMPCGVPTFTVLSEDTTRVVGHGPVHCDTDTAGDTLYVFPHCTLTLNYPGNDDYGSDLPIGLLVKPYDC